MSGLLEEHTQDTRWGEASPETTQQAFGALLDAYLDGLSDATRLLDLLRSDTSASSCVQSLIAAKKEQLAASSSPQEALQSWRKLDGLLSQWMQEAN